MAFPSRAFPYPSSKNKLSTSPNRAHPCLPQSVRLCQSPGAQGTTGGAGRAASRAGWWAVGQGRALRPLWTFQGSWEMCLQGGKAEVDRMTEPENITIGL